MSQINTGFDNNTPQAIDRSYGKLIAGVTTPYASPAEAIANVPINYRYRGKTVVVDSGLGLIEYWWRVDTQDSSLVPKVLLDQYVDFIIGDGGGFTPAPAATSYTNPTLINCKILAVEIEGAEIALRSRIGTAYAGYDPIAGKITLFNTVFSLDSWYKITFRQL